MWLMLEHKLRRFFNKLLPVAHYYYSAVFIINGESTFVSSIVSGGRLGFSLSEFQKEVKKAYFDGKHDPTILGVIRLSFVETSKWTKERIELVRKLKLNEMKPKEVTHNG